MKCYSLLGVNVNALTIVELNRLIKTAVAHGEKTIIANHNLHSVYLFHHDAKMRSFYGGVEYVHIDGMPLVYWARFLGMELKLKHRTTYVDWIKPMLKEAAENDWRVFYLGGKEGVAAKAVGKIKTEFPGLQVRYHHGYFDQAGDANREVLSMIAEFRPQILLVGMGMPRQEYWIKDNYAGIAANAVLTAGACFDYLAGAIPTPPRWLGRAGLEWVYRLLHEPRRLWKRYLWEPWYILPLAIKDLGRRLKGK
jgi:N-acetylglucosaminyldiphosphoundecaprenol N-acetyl-beta-D-mannosaminyltransferase